MPEKKVDSFEPSSTRLFYPIGSDVVCVRRSGSLHYQPACPLTVPDPTVVKCTYSLVPGGWHQVISVPKRGWHQCHVDHSRYSMITCCDSSILSPFTSVISAFTTTVPSFQKLILVAESVYSGPSVQEDILRSP